MMKMLKYSSPMRTTIPLILLTFSLIGFCHSQLCDIKVMDDTKENHFLIDLNSFDKYSPSSILNKKFNLLGNGKVNDLFRLQNNGKLYSAKLIDREQLCKDTEMCCETKDPCGLTLAIAISSESFTEPRTFECRVLVEDINDNAPVFEKEKITISIKESEPVGSLFPLPFARDLDSERFSVRDYKLEEKSMFPPTFSLEQHRPSTNLNLQLIQRLDREKRAHYELVLLAIDRGSPPKTGKLVINIIVLDENDNPPHLTRTNYIINYEESKFTTQPLLTIEAKDDDENENAQLYFKIVDENPIRNEAAKYFRIEQKTGRIFLNQKLDFEKQEKHRFFVEVSNNVGQVDTATATVLINVENLNDELPVISVNYLNNGKNNADIKENDMKMKFVAIVTVTDKDKGPGGQVQCRLTNYNDVFDLQAKEISNTPNQYNIYTKVSLDRESIGHYELQIECEDKGYPILKAKSHVKINVNDVNDNRPKINLDNNISVKENQPPGTLVTQISATDPDEGRNSELIYSISESDEETQKYLEINSQTGELKTKLMIDREKDPEPLVSLPVSLTVTDKGDPPLSTMKMFSVKIEDENDNPPEFQSNLSFNIHENQPARYTLGEISVTDRDDTSNLRVSLVPSPNEPSSPFLLFHKDNKYYLNTTKSLDWEKQQNYSFKVIASDGKGYKSHTVTASILVNVIDENDHAPLIIFPSHNNFTKTISYLEKSEIVILTVSAQDKDGSGSPNGKFYFQMINDNKDSFAIHSITGKITIARTLTRNDIGRNYIKVIVRDQGNPPRESFIHLTIIVDDSKPQMSGHLIDPNKDGNDDKGRSTASYLLSKEGFLITSLIILLLFLLLCIFMILYMRHIRGLFPMLPDIFEGCICFSDKRTKTKKNNSYHKSNCDIPANENRNFTARNSPLDFHQQARNNDNLLPFFCNQYDSSTNNAHIAIDQKLPVTQFRQYETMSKYQHYSPPFLNQKSTQSYNYDQLFYHHPSSTPCEDSFMIPIVSTSNGNNFYDSRIKTIPNNLNQDITICHRIMNNIDPSPLITDEKYNENPKERFSSNPCLKSDLAESFAVETSQLKTPDIRRQSKKNEKIDTYAVTYPKEQSTFV